MIQVVEAVVAVAVVAEFPVSEAIAVPEGRKGETNQRLVRFALAILPPYSLRHWDFVQLHGFLGLTPAASKVWWDVGAAASSPPEAAGATEETADDDDADAVVDVGLVGRLAPASFFIWSMSIMPSEEGNSCLSSFSM